MHIRTSFSFSARDYLPIATLALASHTARCRTLAHSRVRHVIVVLLLYNIPFGVDDHSISSAKASLFLKHPKGHLLPCFDHFHHTNVAYAQELIVYPFFDVILFHTVTVFVFAVMSSSLHMRERRCSLLGDVTYGTVIQHCIPYARPA